MANELKGICWKINWILCNGRILTKKVLYAKREFSLHSIQEQFMSSIILKCIFKGCGFRISRKGRRKFLSEVRIFTLNGQLDTQYGNRKTRFLGCEPVSLTIHRFQTNFPGSSGVGNLFTWHPFILVLVVLQPNVALFSH